ncbi:MAG: TlyA family RNA methyltransferase [Elusimicrobia bacterium]|nr:TlyA family RNA methyltransferase [Elusimicrobiota bacterium]MBP9127421.1 TlyA family RNA methyltransferase [Elusimicrobiota bacterium]
MVAKSRLDDLLVRRGLAKDRKEAQALLLAGRVRAPGSPSLKAGTKVSDDVILEREPGKAFVSRGGLKLRGALDAFQISVAGRTCVDIGASTGGFTDCLLKAGAVRVLAVDVGRGQLDWSLQKDPRVVNREKTHVLRLTRSDMDLFGGDSPVFPLVTVDVSFISLETVLPHLASLLRSGTEMVCLVKPQFEADPKDVPGGVVIDPRVCDRMVEKVSAVAREAGFDRVGLCESPITGPEGNREFFLHLRRR